MTDGPIAWIFLVVALVFIFGGSKKLADLGKGFGGFMKEFSKAKKEGEEEATKTIDEKPTPPPSQDSAPKA